MAAIPPHHDIDPTAAQTVEELAELLQQLRTRADQPSFRTMERWGIKNRKPLSRATVADMLAGRTFPTKARLCAFLQVCGVEPGVDVRWEHAWNRLAEQRRQQQPGISRLGSAGEEAARALGLGMAAEEAEDLLEPTWADAEERLAAITDAATATAEVLRTQLAALRLAGAEVGTTLDNARLNRLESLAAATLQRSMMPTRPPKLPGVRIAHHYRPGGSQIPGGDWFDAIQLPGGRAALIVGDVMGHGLISAAVMGQFRTAIITMAALDLPPAQLLRHLDNLAHRLGPEHLATCVYAVYDPIHRNLSIANAGHMPPVLASDDGRSEVLRLPTAAPIGVGGVPFETVEIPIPDGSWLILCTDGLVEVRGQDEGLAALCANVIELQQTPEDVCDQILNRVHSEDSRDDVALLVAHFEGIASDDVAEFKLRMDLTEVRRARELTRKQLHQWDLDSLADVAEQLVSELVTNALHAASHQVELRLMRVGQLLVEVSDDNHNLPQLRRTRTDDEDGRGLMVVSRLSSRWGTSRQAVGKVVWFELPLPPS